jgi:iron-sulfur cluster repair protein YtfE (RIC family)
MTTTGTAERRAIRTFAELDHEDLAAGMDRLHALGEALATMPVDQQAAGVRRVLQWVDADLRPHMAWEESWLFPEIDARAGSQSATSFVRLDHEQISAQADRVQSHATRGNDARSHETASLIADLSGLETLLRANVEREERLILPMLEPEAERWEPEWRD